MLLQKFHTLKITKKLYINFIHTLVDLISIKKCYTLCKYRIYSIFIKRNFIFAYIIFLILHIFSPFFFNFRVYNFLILHFSSIFFLIFAYIIFLLLHFPSFFLFFCL